MPRAPYVTFRRPFFNANLLLTVLAVFWLAWPAAPARAEAPRILILGDSLTAGYGLAADEAFPVRLQAALEAAGIEATVLNAGVSGDTTAGGRARLDWSLSSDPDFAIVELGANDGLRGLDPDDMRANLDAILSRLDEANVPTLLTGMRAPPNLGREYGKAFYQVYTDLADAHDVPLYPFFLDGVAADPSLNQDDGIHPNAEGVAVIVERILPYVKRLIDHDG